MPWKRWLQEARMITTTSMIQRKIEPQTLTQELDIAFRDIYASLVVDAGDMVKGMVIGAIGIVSQRTQQTRLHQL